LAQTRSGDGAAGPHVVELVVDGLVAEEVHRADDVVPRALLEQLGHAVLAAGDEVGLDAQAQVGLLADEVAVGVEVVLGVVAPQRVLPDVQRGREAVDVLADAQLGDAALLGDGPVALGVGGGEVAVGGGARLVGPQMHVVVGQHGALVKQPRVGGRRSKRWG
jgi:hypothetical protein